MSTNDTMGEEVKCATGWARCNKERDIQRCNARGYCCYDKISKETENCICIPPYYGSHCFKKTRPGTGQSEEAYRRTELIAAFSAILGVVVILLFVALIVLQVKYYRNRKKRRGLGEHDLDRIPKSEDPDSKLSLRNEPGYSWRESARRSTMAYQKLNGPLSRSVPEDLFKMGMKIALFGMKGDEENKKNGNRNPDALGRCFSADANSGGGGGGVGEIPAYRYTKLQETAEIDSKEKTVSDQKTENTVR